jgi:hypothetical protein
MLKKFLALLLICSTCARAETIKTDVLVIGGTVSGTTAAIQSARSKVKTLLISSGKLLEQGFVPAANYTITTNKNLPTGVWGEFCDKTINFYNSTTGYQAPPNAALKFDGSTGIDILLRIADTVKNLTIKTDMPFTSIKKDGSGWEVTSVKGDITTIIDAKIIVDATEKGEVVVKAGVSLPPMLDRSITDAGQLYRTSVAVSDVLTEGFVAMRNLIVRNTDNLLVTEAVLPLDRDAQYLPLQMAVGQGAGAMAAYCAFFKTSTKNLKVRVVQQELLDYKAWLMPFTDIKPNEHYIRAVQQIGATGMLKGEVKNNELYFMPEKTVFTGEIKPVLTEIYTRAFLWFNKEKPGEKFTEGNLLSLISEMTLSDPKTLQTTMQRDWKQKYHFTSDFDLSRPVTRLEFAALVNQFLNPFARTVDMAGNIVN